MAADRPYPSKLVAELDPSTSRWLWLVKWLLVIPHFVVLFFLWIATVVLTIVAGFAILFTGRYPRKIFDFNVGVFRWTWRVSYYAIGAFGTDRYPPFSLRPDSSYPADFQVEYPDTLSRGLVLIKWWLLALPHYCIVAFFAGGLGVGLDLRRLADSQRVAVSSACSRSSPRSFTCWESRTRDRSSTSSWACSGGATECSPTAH